MAFSTGVERSTIIFKIMKDPFQVVKLLVNYYNGAKILLSLTVLSIAVSVYVDCCTIYRRKFSGNVSFWI